jgi:lipopolysaccharide transport protein LptA|tara:strand:- start:1030 stop:1479 length:450 start_codon:yes stop_codon:yes gene_type:complete
MKKIYLIIFIFLGSYAFGDKSNDPYFYIDSDKLIITDNPTTSEFIGNAYARNSESHFWGDKILVNYDDNKEIELITIIRNVRIKRANEEITGDKAIYNLKLENINITSNVSITKNGDVLNGDELIIDLITSSSIIKGNNSNQVSAKIIK